MTLLVKNVRIVGGDREFPDAVDVFVNNDKISAIGNFPNKNADTVVDGQGITLTPGFIDVNTDSDHYLTLFSYPSQADFLKQGVTTIFGGMCGSSLAPLLYGSLESIRKWGNPDSINVDWHTMAEFLATLERRPLAVNFGTLIGHSTIRRAIVGDSIRDLTKNEMNVFVETLKKAMDEGGFGLSSGLEYVHARKTSYGELKRLAEAVKEMDGIYATHVRYPGDGVKASIEETVKLAKETGVTALVSHFMPLARTEKEYEEALGIIEALPAKMKFRFDAYASDRTLLPLYTFLPIWAQTGSLEVMNNDIKDEWMAGKLVKDMPRIKAEYFVIASAPGNEFFVGKTLEDIKEMYAVKDEREALVKYMIAVKLRGTVLYKSIDTATISKAIHARRSFIATNAPSFGKNEKEKQLKSERTTSTFTKFLSMVEDRKLMTFEDAIRKITKEPADFFGLQGRGVIKEGNYADLVGVKDAEIRFTVVNGSLVYKDDEFLDKFPGKALRRASRK